MGIARRVGLFGSYLGFCGPGLRGVAPQAWTQGYAHTRPSSLRVSAPTCERSGYVSGVMFLRMRSSIRRSVTLMRRRYGPSTEFPNDRASVSKRQGHTLALQPVYVASHHNTDLGCRHRTHHGLELLGHPAVGFAAVAGVAAHACTHVTIRLARLADDASLGRWAADSIGCGARDMYRQRMAKALKDHCAGPRTPAHSVHQVIAVTLFRSWVLLSGGCGTFLEKGAHWGGGRHFFPKFVFAPWEDGRPCSPLLNKNIKTTKQVNTTKQTR